MDVVGAQEVLVVIG